MTRVLYVDDDTAQARSVVARLHHLGYAMDHVTTGAEAVSLASRAPYSLIILDVELSDMSGFEVLRSVRRAGIRAPALILTARNSVRDRVMGLDCGADDYLLKPSDPAELEARVRALVRRGEGDPRPMLVVGRLQIDRTSGEVRIDDKLVALRRRELAVLNGLAVRAGRIVAKERLVDEVFAYDEACAPNAIELYVARLRKKLPPGGPQIKTIRGLGYILEPA